MLLSDAWPLRYEVPRIIKDTRALAPAEPMPLTTLPRTTWNSDVELPL